MASEIAEKLNSDTIVECKEIEVKKGSLENKLWIEIVDENKVRVSLEIDEYLSIMETLKKALKENVELKLEREILARAPKDFEDVKAVVLEEMKKSNESIYKIVDKVAREHSNLFYQLGDVGINLPDLNMEEEIPF